MTRIDEGFYAKMSVNDEFISLNAERGDLTDLYIKEPIWLEIKARVIKHGVCPTPHIQFSLIWTMNFSENLGLWPALEGKGFKRKESVNRKQNIAAT